MRGKQAFSCYSLLFFVGQKALAGGYDLFTDFFGHDIVMGIRHLKAASTGGHGAKLDRVLEHLCLWNLSVDDLEMSKCIDTHDTAPAGVEIAHDIAKVLIRNDDLDVHDRLKEDRRSFSHALLERKMCGSLERHF